MEFKSTQPVLSSDLTATLRQQKRELAILTAIFQTISNSTTLKDTLEKALDIVLTALDSSIGWVCLLWDDGTCEAFVGQQGLCMPAGDNVEKKTPCLVRCVCSRVRRTSDIVVMDKLTLGCPLLVLENGQTKPIVGHVSLPLTAKSRIVGQLNVAFNDRKQVDQMDLDLLRTIGPQLGVVVENARLWEEVQNKEHLRKELLKKVVSAQEEERRQLSRELHDELGQEMTSLLVRLQVLENLGPGEAASELVAGMKKTVMELLTLTHDMALELRPPSLDDIGLVAALAQYTKSVPGYLGIKVDFEAVGCERCRLPREVETTLYRIIQESLTNVARHSGASQASVLLEKKNGAITAIIEDNGVGFDLRDVRTAQSRKSHLGLYGMEERAALVGGTFTIESKPGAGTTIYVEIPIGND